MARHKSQDKRVLVIGLGRFGGSLATELVTHKWDVLGMDSNTRRVQAYSDTLTHTVVADATDAEALRQLGAHEFTRAVVAIGSHLEESILTTSLLVDMGVPHIWAKAINRRHGRILQQIGAHHVVLPEHDMGERVAHLVSGRMLDFIEIEENFALAKTRAPREILNRRLGESGIRANYRITVVCIKRHGEQFTYATADTVPQKGDIVIVAGTTEDVERFSEQD